MISIPTALQLQQAGLTWHTAAHDFFAIPNTDLDERVFVITDMMAELTVLKGWPAITFNGAVEWALDYILQMEAVWLPREDQLRTAVAERTAAFHLEYQGQYECTVIHHDTPHTFTAATAEEAYAAALLFLLQP